MVQTTTQRGLTWLTGRPGPSSKVHINGGRSGRWLLKGAHIGKTKSRRVEEMEGWEHHISQRERRASNEQLPCPFAG